MAHFCAQPDRLDVRSWPMQTCGSFRGRPILPSRPGEFHPEPLTDPDVILSHHPARVIARRLPPSAEISGSSRGITQLAQAQRR
jgi:hypothetical protein